MIIEKVENTQDYIPSIYYQQILNSEVCDAILQSYLPSERVLSQEETDQAVYSGPHADYINEIMFRTRFLYTCINKELINNVIDYIIHNHIRPIYKLGDYDFQTPNFMKFVKNDLFKTHSDNTLYDKEQDRYIDMFGRSYTMVIYLNSKEDFKGGNLIFPRLGYSLSPDTGYVAFFPNNNIAYDHGVERVESGVRYCLATWLTLTT